MILILNDALAPIYRGRKGFILVENYRGKIKKVMPGEIGTYHDSEKGQVRVVVSPHVQRVNANGERVGGFWLDFGPEFQPRNRFRKIERPA